MKHWVLSQNVWFRQQSLRVNNTEQAYFLEVNQNTCHFAEISDCNLLSLKCISGQKNKNKNSMVLKYTQHFTIFYFFKKNTATTEEILKNQHINFVEAKSLSALSGLPAGLQKLIYSGPSLFHLTHFFQQNNIVVLTLMSLQIQCI